MSFSRKLVFLIIIFSCASVKSQEANYWNKQHGPTSNFLGGAVTGGVRDNSSIFYNPGASAFTTDFNLSIQSDAISYENIYIRNGAGEGENLHYGSFESSPQMIAFTYGVKKRPNWRTSFGYISTEHSNIKLRSRTEELVDIYSDNIGEEIYIGSWNYQNRIREDWYGGALTRKVGDNLGIGLSTFLTFRTYDYVQSQDQNIFVPDSSGGFQPNRYVYFSDILNGSAAGILLKLGIAWEIKDFKLGLSVTSPRAQLNFLGSFFLSGTQYSQLGEQDTLLDVPNYTIQYDKAKSTYKSPWIIDFGVMKNYFNTDIYIRVAYHANVDLYEMVEPKDPSEISKLISSEIEGAGTVVMAHKEIWNIGIGWSRQFTEKFGMMAGFRTDHNYLDREALNQVEGVVPTISYWNNYHISGGTTVTVLKHKFTLGLTYAHGSERNGEQFFNLAPPDKEEVFQEPDVTAQAFYDSFNVLIGYVYNF